MSLDLDPFRKQLAAAEARLVDGRADTHVDLRSIIMRDMAALITEIEQLRAALRRIEAWHMRQRAALAKRVILGKECEWRMQEHHEQADICCAALGRLR